MSQNVARRAYSAEQLLALRRSASDEPAMAIESKAEKATVIKDHVLRGTRSLAERSAGSLGASDTLRPPIDTRSYVPPVLGEIDPNNQSVRPGSRFQYSPTPSLKKKKAEQILKQHGSPPGLRVTAGGRIVPSDQSPLCSPRFGYSAINKNGGLIRFAPGYPPTGSFQNPNKPIPNGFVAQDPSGRLCQMVDDRFLPINEVNGIPQLYMTAPNLNNISSSKAASSSDRSAGHSPSRLTNTMPPPAQVSSGPSLNAQIAALEKQYTKLEIERRDLDKAEVLQRSAMTGKAYQQLIQKRRELVSRLNDVRVGIKGLQDAKKGADGPLPSHGMSSAQLLNPMQRFMGVPSMPSLPYGTGWNFDANLAEPYGMLPFATAPTPADLSGFAPHPFYAGPSAPFMPFQPFYEPGQAAAMPGVIPQPAQAINASPTQPEQGSRPRSNRSPEVIQVYRDEQSNPPVSENQSISTAAALSTFGPITTKSNASAPGQKVTLNPMSPSYEPGTSKSKTATPEKKNALTNGDGHHVSSGPAAALAAAVRAHNAWAGSTGDASRTAVSSQEQLQQDRGQHSSDSSYATADFFPQNPRDHSMNKQAYPIAQESSTEDLHSSQLPPSDEPPVTPEKERHNPNWNPTIPDQAFKTEMSPREQIDMARSRDGTVAELHGSEHDPIPNRSELNVSPKSRRSGVLQSHKSISEVATLGSPETTTTPSGPAPSLLDLTTKPADYVEGFRAGLERSQIGPDKGGVFLDGYCSGLLKSGQLREAVNETMHTSMTADTVDHDAPHSNASSVAKRIERRSEICPSPPRQLARPPLELNLHSFDTLTEAILAPQNENALLSPDLTGPGPQIVPNNLGAWSKTQERPIRPEVAIAQMRNGETAFSERTSSMVSRQLEHRSSISVGNKPLVGQSSNTSQAVSQDLDAHDLATDRATRAVSSQSQPPASAQASYLQRVYPGHRVLSSPALDWKSATSIAQVAGLAQGYFAQYDGTTAKSTGTELSTPLKVPLPVSPKFHEGTMTEEERVVSTSPHNTSPSKKSLSPAKAKFAQIAGKAGINVRVDRPASKGDNTLEPEQMSPQERRRWRDVWKKRHAAAE